MPRAVQLRSRSSAAAINAGQKATQFCGNRSPDRIFGFNKLKVLRQINPVFDKLYCSKILIARPRAPRPLPTQSIVLTPEAAECHRVASLVPHHLPRDIRDDVIQSIFLAILEGSIRRDQLPARVADFIRAHYREANRHGVGKYGLVSLDAPGFADSSMTLKDTIQSGQGGALACPF